MWPSSRLSRRESSASSLKNRDGGRWPSISKKHPELCTLYCRKNCQLAAASFWNGLFGVKEISLQRDIKSAKPKDHLWIFGQKRQKLQRIIYILHVTSWSSAAYIYNLHLQRHVLAPPGQAFSRVVCDEPAGPVSSGTPRLFTSFLKYFTSYLGLRFIYIYEVVVSLISIGIR